MPDDTGKTVQETIYDLLYGNMSTLKQVIDTYIDNWERYEHRPFDYGLILAASHISTAYVIESHALRAKAVYGNDNDVIMQGAELQNQYNEFERRVEKLKQERLQGG